MYDFTLSVYAWSSFSASSIAFGESLFLFLPFWYVCDFTSHFPNCWWSQATFHVVFATWLSSTECLFVSFIQALIELFAFLLLNFKSSFYILDTNPLPSMWFANMFSKLVACLFILLTESFIKQFEKYVDEAQFTNFSFKGSCFLC